MPKGYTSSIFGGSSKCRAKSERERKKKRRERKEEHRQITKTKIIMINEIVITTITVSLFIRPY